MEDDFFFSDEPKPKVEKEIKVVKSSNKKTSSGSGSGDRNKKESLKNKSDKFSSKQAVLSSMVNKEENL